MNVLAIGEAPNGRDDSGAGDKVVLSSPAYERKLPGLTRLRRVNLLDSWPGPQGKGSAFPLQTARAAAGRLWAAEPLSVRFLILSLRASFAFRMPVNGPRAEWFGFNGRQVAVIPHPSGIVRWWNDPENREKARTFMEGL